jgi:hypothetical protein
MRPVGDVVAYDYIALRPVEHTPGWVDEAAAAEDLGHS